MDGGAFDDFDAKDGDAMETRRPAGTLSIHIWLVGVVGVASIVVGAQPAVASESESPAEPFTVAVISDMNGGYGSTSYGETVYATIEWLTEQLQPDLVVSTGDHVAGQKSGLDYAAMWEAFHRAVTEPLAEAGIPFAPTPGNHDASAAPKYRGERDRYVDEWRDRRPEVRFVDDTHFPLRYAFRAGPALFISIDATMPGRLPDEQFEWLRAVLENRGDARGESRDGATSATGKNRDGAAGATKIIVYGHLPLVPFARGKRDEALKSERLEQLFRETGVDVVLSGHHHAYYPGRRGDLRLVGLGCLGTGPRALMGTEERGRRSAVVLQIHDDTVEIQARSGPSMEERIPRQSLPRSIGSGRWRVFRDDLRPSQQPPSREAAEQLSELR